jgi:hypothetical protein
MSNLKFRGVFWNLESWRGSEGLVKFEGPFSLVGLWLFCGLWAGVVAWARPCLAQLAARV